MFCKEICNIIIEYTIEKYQDNFYNDYIQNETVESWLNYVKSRNKLRYRKYIEDQFKIYNTCNIDEIKNIIFNELYSPK